MIYIKNYSRLKRDDLVHLAKLIVEIFNKNTETTSIYYSPASYGKCCKGKLWDAFIRKRAALAAAGVIQRRYKGPNTRTTRKSMPKKRLKGGLIQTITKEIECGMEILKSHAEPWPNIVTHWKLTHNYRKNLLNCSKSVIKYMSDFPCFNHASGFELVRNNT